MSYRITQRSIASTALAGLQGNLARLGETQRRLSSGKQISRPSDSPTGTVAAMQFRGQLSAVRQYSRNADDGIGWLAAADTALTSASTQASRARDLVLQGLSSGASGSVEARGALAAEVDEIRASLIGTANTTYLNRPIFGGTTAGAIAYDKTGTYVGDAGVVSRTVDENTKVRVDTPGADAFGTGNTQLFTVLSDIATDLRANPGALTGDLQRLDTATSTLRSALTGVGARQNRIEQMRDTADSRAVDLTEQLSNVEDIDLPKTLTDLQLQQTAYQAALAANARVIQPSLMDFLH